MVGPEEEWAYFHGSGGDDINGDGLIDVGGTGSNGLRVYFQNPDGTFTDKSSSVTAIFRDNNDLGGIPFGWDFGDVDGDGKAEIVSADYGAGDPNTNPRLNNISVLKYDQSDDIFNLHFLSNESNKLFDYGRGGEHVDIFDINNDGHNDIIVAGGDYRGRTLESWINNGDGTFYAKWGEAFENQYNFREFKMLDANNDGYLDIAPNTPGFITGNSVNLNDDRREGLDYNQFIFLNDGTGNFARELSKSYIDLYAKVEKSVSYIKDGKLHIFGMLYRTAEERPSWNGKSFLLLTDIMLDID